MAPTGVKAAQVPGVGFGKAEGKLGEAGSTVEHWPCPERHFIGLHHSCVSTRNGVRVFVHVWGWGRAKWCMGSALTQTALGSLCQMPSGAGFVHAGVSAPWQPSDHQLC